MKSHFDILLIISSILTVLLMSVQQKETVLLGK